MCSIYISSKSTPPRPLAPRTAPSGVVTCCASPTWLENRAGSGRPGSQKQQPHALAISRVCCSVRQVDTQPDT